MKNFALPFGSRLIVSMRPRLDFSLPLGVTAVAAPAAFLTIIVLWIVTYLARVLPDITLFPGHEGDGPFQLFNPLRRIAAGQTGGTDFQYFHGLGIPYLHYPIYALGGKTLYSAELARHLISMIAFLGSTIVVFAALTQRLTPTLVLTVLAIALNEQLELHGLSKAGNGLMGLRTAAPYFALAVLLWEFRPRREAAILGPILGLGFLLGVEHGVAALAMVGIVWLGRRWFQLPGGSFRWLGGVLAGMALTAGSCLLAIGGPSGAAAAIRFAFLEMPQDQFWYFGVPPNPFLVTWFDVATDRPLWLRAVGPFVIVVAMAIRRMRTYPNERPVLLAVLGLVAYGTLGLASYFGYCSIHYLEPLTRVAIIGGLILAWCSGWYSRTILAAIAAILLIAGPNVSEPSSLFHLPSQARIVTKEFRKIRDGDCRMAPKIQGELDAVTTAIDAHRAARNIDRPPVIWSTYAGRIEDHYGIFHPYCDYAIHALGAKRRAGYLAAFREAQPDFVITFKPSAFGWEPWLRNSTWDFYEEMLLNYDVLPTIQKRFSVWRRKDAPWRNVDPSVGVEYSLDGPNWFAVPAPPGCEATWPRVVEVEYAIDNPLAGVPMIGGLPRHLLGPIGAQSLPISLPPYRTSWSFPIFPNGNDPPLIFAKTFSLVGGQVTINRVRIRRLDAAPEQIKALLE
ncbi:MAG TPA: hypothetical protein VGI99_02115 [Gemmataceae bacterium]